MPPALTGTYRLQLRAEFGFADAAAVVPYLSDLGVSHLYLSPILQAAPDSTHGYDVVDHTVVSADLGGEDGLRALARTAHRHGMGLVVDVVPNHMAVPTPATLNAKLWSVLRDGPASPYARWFDVDWSGPDRALLVPVLGSRIGQVLDAGELSVEEVDGEAVLRYYERVFPLRPGTERLAMAELLQRQWYRLAHWRVGDEELNYRRFFDVDTLAAIRVELPEVFSATHDLLVRLREDGVLDGYRIDHPDGLADPRGYLAALREVTGGAWVVVEKILEGAERLPADWACAGSSGYDTLNRLVHLLVDPDGENPLRALWTSVTGDPRDLRAVIAESKRQVLATSLRAEVTRLVDLAVAVCADDLAMRDFTRHRLTSALVEMLVAFGRYRAYVVPGEPADGETVALLDAAVTATVAQREDLADEARLLAELALGRLGRGPDLDDFCVRFQQTCGPVMAKGVEDTAFYRWFPLTALAEVGGWPAPMGTLPETPPGGDAVDGLHRWARRQQAEVPMGMTTLSTHDTKRSEDVRARLAVLAEDSAGWGRALTAWRAAAAGYRAAELDPATEYLVWQTVVGAWPIEEDRLLTYLEKAAREAKLRTSWTDPDEGYDRAVRAYARHVLGDADLRASVAGYVEGLAPAARVNTLSQKLLQLTLPGVPDVYQGCEALALTLVDPDNRRAVDYADRRERLAALDRGGAPRDLADEKLLVTATTLRLRRERPASFGPGGAYRPWPTGTPHAVGLLRGDDVLAVATRLPLRLAGNGGWGDAALDLPAGDWADRLGRRTHSGRVPLADLLRRLPVAMLARTPNVSGPHVAGAPAEPD